MAKAKKKKVNIFDLTEGELKNVSKKIITDTNAPAPKPEISDKLAKEPLKVLRVGLSFHRKAKRMAVDRDIMIQEVIEELILEKWESLHGEK